METSFARVPFGVVYLATNSITGKRYVGQTTQPVMTRWKRHVSDALGSRQRPHPLHNSIRKHGPDAWQVEAIVECASYDALNLCEATEIAARGTTYPDGYNLKPGGNNAGHHEETKRKLAEALRGTTLPPEQREKMRQSALMREQTPAQLAGWAKCRAMSAARKGQPGTPNSQEACAKMSAAHAGVPKSPAHRAAIGAAHVGMKRSTEAIANMKAAWVVRKQRQLDRQPSADCHSD